MMAPQRQLYLLFLKLSDLALLVSALGWSLIVYYWPAHDARPVIDFLSERIKVGQALLGGGLLMIWHLGFSLQGLYQTNRLRQLADELKDVGRAVLIAAVALFLVGRLGRWQAVNLWTVGVFGLWALVLDGGFRVALSLALRYFRQRGRNAKSLLLVGGGRRGQQIVTHLKQRRDLNYQLVGYVESEAAYGREPLAGVPWLGAIVDLPAIVAEKVIDEVIIALPVKSQYAQIQSLITLFEEQGITVHLLADLFQPKLSRCRVTEIAGLSFVSLHSAPVFDWRTEVKRMIDLLVSAILLIALIPLFILVAIAIKLDSPGPVFFVQTRVGYHRRLFRLYKFRTMVADAEARLKELEHLNEKDGPIFKIRHDPRITRVGRWLRKTSIDELPQLLNVILGDMSLVGPRPLSLRDALGLEESWQKRRFSVKPGLTCLWQVSGRSNLSFEQWMQLDLQYIDHWSLSLDLRILLRTIPAVFSGEGAV